MYNSLWYYSLTKPELCPPDSIFAPVWSVLYATMIISIITYTLSFGKNKFSVCVILVFYLNSLTIFLKYSESDNAFFAQAIPLYSSWELTLQYVLKSV